MAGDIKTAGVRYRSRRELLRFVLGSPLVAYAGAPLAALSAWWPEVAIARPELAVPDAARRALDVFQMQAAAQRQLDPAAWHFIVGGADDGKTVAANRGAFDAWQIRARRLIDVSSIDTGIELFGQRLPSPLLLAPAGDQAFVYEGGELATARAVTRSRHAMICSMVSSNSITEIAAATEAPLWFQLYPSRHRAFMQYLIARAEQAGCRALVLTVDGPTLGNREAERWFRTRSERRTVRLGNFEDYPAKKGIGDPSITWETVAWLREQTSLPLVLKGIVTGEDAALCIEHGVDGIIVSNHGGRQEESGRGTLECLPEIVAATDGAVPVLIDGGFRRGTDIFKALALGANAVCIGRPYLWGLGAFGEAGVARVLSLLDTELARIMKFAGTTDIESIRSGERLLAER
jgi:4-hydroxymandelate oxidase